MFVRSFSLALAVLVSSCNDLNLNEQSANKNEPMDSIANSETCLVNICYQLTFTEVWSASNFPTQYPSNSHFSPLTGVSHGPAVDFYELNQSASQGIEVMAETGGVNPLTAEFNDAIQNKTAFKLIEGGGISNSHASTVIEFSVNDAHPMVTLVSMIAPSPDWFVGVDSLNLKDSNGDFQDNLSINLVVYDAGTDKGTTYTAGNSEENGVITTLTCNDLVNHCAFVNGQSRDGVEYIGTFEFTRIY